ncbi:hypothetical protein [Deinococcus multiflagellatus]|uniref:Uncharacterized protein n=1 Tax=Deinococcus multiflagellatus TaxID=1656887 RepID=A0ABW1ZH53_9DEIO
MAGPDGQHGLPRGRPGVEALAAGTAGLNRVTMIQKVLLTEVSVLFTRAKVQAVTYAGGLSLGATASNVFSAATTRASVALGVFTKAISVYTIAATAALALGLYWADQVKKTTEIYAQADEASMKSFNAMQARITQLAKSGNELDRARARYLITQQALMQAQEAPIVGTNFFTGERIYGKVDEARVKKLQGDLVAAKDEVTRLYTEAQRRGQLNLKLTQDQTKAVKELTKTLEGRQFDLKIEGLSEMGADLARLGKEFDDLKIKFKAPFTVNGKLMDPAQTPALRQGLAQIDTQRLAEEAAVRAKYAREAAAAARKAALDTQSAEIEAMRDGAAKRTAERRAEIAQIQQAAKEEAARYADFPKQKAAIESEARRTIAAKRKLWAREDQDLSKEEAKKAQEQAATTAARILEAEQAAQTSQIAAMADGRAKKEAQRQAELDELKASIAQKVAALADDPEAQAAQRASGETQVAAKLIEQARQRAQEERDAQQQVTEARRAAREAELAAIKDEGQRVRAQRELEVEDYRAAVQRRLDALKGYPEKQAAVLAAARTQTQALERRWAQEDVERAKATAQRVADAWLKAQGAQFQAQEATRDAEAAGFELRLSRQLAAAQGNALRVAKLEAGAVQERARLAENAAKARYDNERKTLRTNLDRALADEKLTASERRALWAAYYADLNQLAAAFQADERKRQQQREQEEREAAARLALLPARQALQGADTRVRKPSGAASWQWAPRRSWRRTLTCTGLTANGSPPCSRSSPPPRPRTGPRRNRRKRPTTWPKPSTRSRWT